MKTQEIIKNLKLERHPEGGFFGEVYRSADILDAGHLPDRIPGRRNICTSIYYLLSGQEYSAFHRLASDEIWHFYMGNPLTIYELVPEIGLKKTRLGVSISEGDQLQYVVKKGHWFAADIENGGDFSLMGCTMAPGFDFADFELANFNTLAREYPDYCNLIDRLVHR